MRQQTIHELITRLDAGSAGATADPFDGVARDVAAALEVDAATLTLDLTGRLCVVSASDASAAALEWFGVRHGSGPGVAAIVRDDAVIVRDIVEDAGYRQYGPMAGVSGYGSAAAFPVRIDGAPRGALVLLSSRTDPPQARSTSAARRVADALGRLVQRSRPVPHPA